MHTLHLVYSGDIPHIVFTQSVKSIREGKTHEVWEWYVSFKELSYTSRPSEDLYSSIQWRRIIMKFHVVICITLSLLGTVLSAPMEISYDPYDGMIQQDYDGMIQQDYDGMIPQDTEAEDYDGMFQQDIPTDEDEAQTQGTWLYCEWQIFTPLIFGFVQAAYD